MITDFGKLAIELESKTKLELLKIQGSLCGFHYSCLVGKGGRIKRTKRELVQSILRIKQDQFDKDGMYKPGINPLVKGVDKCLPQM